MALPRNFGEFRRALTELARVPSDVAAEAAPRIARLIRRNFRAGRNPYGRQYAALTAGSLRRGRRPPPLRKYAGEVTVAPMAGAGIRVTIDEPHAGFHQTGTRHMAKRIVFPDRGAPKEWSAEIQRAMRRAVRRRLGRAA